MNYKIIYSNRKKLNITVERDRSVVVRAPHHLTEERIAKEVNKKRFWLYKQLHHSPKFHPNPPKKEYVSGESFLFTGCDYPLVIVETADTPLAFDDKFMLAEAAKADAPQLFQDWYIEQAERLIPPRVVRYAKELGVTYQHIKIMDTKYRWGSCTPQNNLHFNWRLIKAPYAAIDYLIVHELCHLRIPNHTPDFWNLVSVVLPEWETGKDWLRKRGEGL